MCVTRINLNLFGLNKEASNGINVVFVSYYIVHVRFENGHRFSHLDGYRLNIIIETYNMSSYKRLLRMQYRPNQLNPLCLSVIILEEYSGGKSQFLITVYTHKQTIQS